MAKKKKDEFEDEFEMEGGKGGGIVSVLIAIVIIIIILALFSLLIKLDVGGFGSGVLQPILKDVPIVNSILPDQSDAQIAEDKGYQYNNVTDATQRIKELEAQLATVQATATTDAQRIAELTSEVERLKVFETNQLEYENRVKEFDENVVFADQAPDIEEYKAYYESINPENAALLYSQVIEQMEVDVKTKEQAERYAKMDPKAAASTLEVMTGDLDLVADLLSSMKTNQSAAIMQEMDPNILAKITKKMSMVE